MATVNPPAFLQNAGATHTAEITRAAIASMLSAPGTTNSLVPRGGVHPTFGAAFATVQNGAPNMSVNVGSGTATIPGTEGSKQSCYFVVNDATVNVTIAASNPSNPRIDVIALKVQDSFYSGATDAWSIVAVTGTPAGSPVAPATPANGVKIAQVAVGAGVTSITNANIGDFRPYYVAHGGILRVFGTTERDSVPNYGGMPVWRTDVAGGLLQIFNGVTWNDYQPSINTFVGETTNATTSRNSTGTEVIGTTVTFTAVTGARYKYTWTSSFQSTIGLDTARLRLRDQTGASLTTGGTQRRITTQRATASTSSEPFSITCTVSGLTGGSQYTAGGTMQRAAGTGTCTVNGNSTDEEYFLVERVA